jgi:hypothetical protein
VVRGILGMKLNKKQTLPTLVKHIEDRGYTNVKVDRNAVSFNIPKSDILSDDETHDVFMQWLSSAFCFGYIKGVAYQKGRTRVWVYQTKTYEVYN